MPVPKSPTADQLEQMVAWVRTSEDVHSALEGLVRAILARATGVPRYTAERGLIGAVEREVRSHTG